jgi:hypothetical protein
VNHLRDLATSDHTWAKAQIATLVVQLGVKDVPEPLVRLHMLSQAVLDATPLTSKAPRTPSQTEVEENYDRQVKEEATKLVQERCSALADAIYRLEHDVMQRARELFGTQEHD